MRKGTETVAVIAAILVLLGIAYIAGLYTTAGSSLFVKLTDPLFAPAATQHINLTYSSVRVRIKNASGSAVIGENVDGSVDLVSLENYSRTIARIGLPMNSSIESLEVNLTSADITINGTTYPLIIPGNVLAVQANGKQAGGSATLLLSISPVILTIYAPNAILFEMVPSLKSVFILGEGAIGGIGGTERINRSTEGRIIGKRQFGITGASLSTVDNISTIAVDVAGSNSSVVLEDLLVSGNEEASYAGMRQQYNITLPNASRIERALSNAGNSTKSLLGSALSELNLSRLSGLLSAIGTVSGKAEGNANSIANLTLPLISEISSKLNKSQANGFLHGVIANLTNSSFADSLKGMNQSGLEAELGTIMRSANLSKAGLNNVLGLVLKANLEANSYERVGLEQSRLGYLAFLIERNGSLSLASAQIEAGPGQGYLLGPGQSAVLRFSGRILLGNGFGVNLIKGDVYSIRIIGSGGSLASLNLTAG